MLLEVTFPLLLFLCSSRYINTLKNIQNSCSVPSLALFSLSSSIFSLFLYWINITRAYLVWNSFQACLELMWFGFCLFWWLPIKLFIYYIYYIYGRHKRLMLMNVENYIISAIIDQRLWWFHYIKKINFFHCCIFFHN